MENNESIFAERLKKLRIDNGISQNELSNYLGITSSSLSYYENGLRTPPITILSKLTNRFNVSVNWLLGLEEPEDTELKTYADMIKLLISLLNCSNIWD
ncbi:MAG: XRE family transcriptional regulator, partial [Lachnospiraceae bacterium]